MPQTPHRYTSPDEDSSRWLDFPSRPGDIVISTRSKHGTTWTQMICALLVLQTPDLPAPLSEISPWLDWLVVPQDVVLARLQAQTHRRFVKTHTPLDGVPIRPDTRYIVVARHPLDAAVSLYHQNLNLDRARIRELTGAPEPATADGEAPKPKPTLRRWLAEWTTEEADPREWLDSLQGVMWHLSDAWSRREEPNVLLVHYADLAADLDGEMRRIAAWLEIEVGEERWPALVRAATFTEMKSNAERVAPDPAGIMRSRDAFFRSGTSGSARDLLTGEELAAYRRRVEGLAPLDLLEWLHRP
ncbi:sulfotransferase domain-containing protein [Glycomyces harbinensis]|uniref:Sulfotransferase domain-containing protein n=1 Tax=Glycomyces harbinensis TaxID=58114 RepID=A0A1G7CBN7_9ACTN|nr:sulfotransferase domain-containing protein [Glycomyces harbinensis]SDE36643.1 Sulfotransferase domain-containing protein [Glycomyces harbinensis]